ncbi:MAG: MBL fold metallo-hydrolase [Chloroflexota bacterium]
MQIYTIDSLHLNIPRYIAVYLILGAGEPILIETGPSVVTPNVVAGLKEQGLEPTDIKHVLVTHIHLDHAGAAGWWAQQGAHIYVHEVGARHLLDPSRLMASATRIYGDRMDTLWGEMIPVPEGQLTAVSDNQTIQIGNIEIVALDTPGHAWHHHTYKIGNIAFTGDATGMVRPPTPLLEVPAPPPEFKADVWLNTLEKIRAENFERIYPTHFGTIDDVDAHLDRFANLIIANTELIRSWMEAGVSREEIIPRYADYNWKRVIDDGTPEEEAHNFYGTSQPAMSVDGIMRYWRKKGVSI